MPDTPFRPLTSDGDWAEARSQSTDQPVVVFKHSAACPISGTAHQEMCELADEDDLTVYKVVVQEHRSVSDEIADALGIRHETPQAILLDETEPVFEASHFDVTADALREALHSASVSR